MKSLIGTGALVRLILRRDRILLPIWLLVPVVLMGGVAASFDELYPTAEARQVLAAQMSGNPAIVTFLGPLFGSSLGALVAWRTGLLVVITVGLPSLFSVIRHTRAEEEAGRRELLGATVVGRHAPLSAALIVALGANLVVAALVVGALIGLGLPAAGSLALGLSAAAVGWMFAALAAVAAQLTVNARTARGIAVAALGLFYLLRAAGDAGGENGGQSWLSWASPIGWTQRVRPFADERWWVFELVFGFVAVLIAAAYALSLRRDLGAGVIAPRLGPAAASPGLRSPLALAWRLQRGALFGWTAGLAVYGLVIGASAQGVSDVLGDSPQLQALFSRVGGEAELTDTFLATGMGILGLMASAYAIQAALRLRSEEANGLAEPVLATPVGRLRWAFGHLVFAVGGPAVALAAAGLTAGLTYGSVTGDPTEELPRLLAGALVQLPAVWVLAGVATALFGLLPRFAALSWAALVLCLLLGQLGEILRLKNWVLDLSPFTHVPKLPGGEVSAQPLIWLVAVAAALVAAGLTAFRHRNIR